MKKIKWLLLIGVAYFWATGNAFSASPALLKPGDVLDVTIQGEPELSGDRVIGRDGSITLPLVGSIGVAGMKTTDAAQLIRQYLADGFLKNPVVSVNPKSFSSKSNKTAGISSSMTGMDDAYAVVDDVPLGSDDEIYDVEEEVAPAANDEEQVLLEIRDMVTNVGVSDAVLTIGNKVYQSNRLGQILVTNGGYGHAIVIADGYKVTSGTFSKMLKSGKAGNPPYIAINKVSIPENVICTVVDKNNRPVKNAEVTLDGGKILTNSRGEFKIGGIKKEFGEIVIKKKGYAVFKKIVDFKSSSLMTFQLTK